MFHDVLTAPEFRQDKLDLAKTQRAAASRAATTTPQSIAGREFASAIYGRDNPYGWQDELCDHRSDLRAPICRRFYTALFLSRRT